MKSAPEVRFVTAITAGGSVNLFVNFSIFTFVFVFLSPKLLKCGKIKGVKCLFRRSGGVDFLTNLMSGQPHN